MASLKQLIGLEPWGKAKPNDSDWNYKEVKKAGEEASQSFKSSFDKTGSNPDSYVKKSGVQEEDK